MDNQCPGNKEEKRFFEKKEVSPLQYEVQVLQKERKTDLVSRADGHRAEQMDSKKDPVTGRQTDRQYGLYPEMPRYGMGQI